ncbi:MAG: hypothetical protein QXG39_07020 [Candidatus Aenigmatarchaeota archaeon]
MSERVHVDMSPVVNAVDRLSQKIDDINRNILLVNSAIAALEAALVAQISDLKHTVINIERQKLHARTEAYGDFLEEVEKDVTDVDARVQAENDELRRAYSAAIDRVLDHIKEEIEIDVEPMQKVLNEFNLVRDDFAKNAVFISEELKQAYTQMYQARLNRLEELRQKIVHNFESFVNSRINLVGQIEELAVHGIPIVDNAIINIPFWIIGIHDGDSEKVFVLPVLERTEHTKEKIANKREPYIEHLSPPSYLSFEELTRDVGKIENIEIARRNKIVFNQVKEKFKVFLSKMQNLGLIHESFATAVEKFSGEVFGDV